MRFNNYSYKNKVIFLFSVSFIVLIIVYQIAIRATVEMYEQNMQLKKTLELLENAPFEKQYLDKRLKEYDEIIMPADSVKNQNHLLKKISEICSKNVAMYDFSEPHLYSENDYTIETNILTFEGKFIPLLFSLQDLEKSTRIGNVVSVNFEKKENKITKSKKLYMTVYIQRYISEK